MNNQRELPKIALGAWAIAKGTLPIIGVTKLSVLPKPNMWKMPLKRSAFS